MLSDELLESVASLSARELDELSLAVRTAILLRAKFNPSRAEKARPKTPRKPASPPPTAAPPATLPPT